MKTVDFFTDVGINIYKWSIFVKIKNEILIYANLSYNVQLLASPPTSVGS